LLGLLEKKKNENKYTEFPSFEIELDDGKKITQSNLENSPLIRLFDEDFVTDNIDWKGKTKPIFFVGADNVKLSEELSEKQKQLENLYKQISEKLSTKEKTENKFKIWKQNLANRTIKDQLRTRSNDKYTNYDRATLERTIKETNDVDKIYLLKDEEKTNLNEKIQQSSLLKIDKLTAFSDIQELIIDTNSILKKTAISNTLERLKDNKETELWVNEGLKLYKENKYSECKFCGCPLTSKILKGLEDHFNDEYQKLSKEIAVYKTLLEESIVHISLKKTDFDLELRTKFEDKKQEIEKIVKAFNEIIQDLIIKVNSKIPNKKTEEFSIDEKDENFQKAKILNNSIDVLNELILEHNDKVDNFDKEILLAKKKIELCIIAENIKDFRDYETQLNSLSQEETKLKKQYSQVKDRITEIEVKLSDTAKAVEQINKYLKDYFGRDEIQLKFNKQEKGFNIKRKEKIASNLSEGERTGIAFIYFLTKLEEKNFDKSKCIVIVDDPVSSLDSNSLYFAFAFLKEKLRDVHQLFILTHTFDFLRQVKNWFHHIQRNGSKNKADYFMIDCYWESGQRKSKIKPMDKLLIDYQSEYHYLLKLLIDLSKDSEHDLEKVYNYPNITRKFLEVFLSFKYPHKHKLYNKMKELVSKNIIDEHTQIGISRFINELSHEFNEDRAETFNMSHLFSAKEVERELSK